MFPESFLSLLTKPYMCVCCIVANTSLCTHINMQALFYSNGPIATLIATSKAVEFDQHTCLPVGESCMCRDVRKSKSWTQTFFFFLSTLVRKELVSVHHDETLQRKFDPLIWTSWTSHHVK